MLWIIGLGLSDEKDITVKGLEAIKRSKRIYLEAYTSILMVNKERLEAFYGKSVTVADREMVEQGSDDILAGADTEDVAFLVVGDPFGATTHSDLVLRAKELSIEVKVIHNASVMNAIGCCGLQLYNYGATVSIPFYTDSWQPTSFYQMIRQNGKLHTLCLLDIKVKEQSIENMARGRKVYEPARYMTVNQALEQLLVAEDIEKLGLINQDTQVVGMARLGADDQVVKFGSVKDLISFDFGGPLHCLVIPGEMHFLELDNLAVFK